MFLQQPSPTVRHRTGSTARTVVAAVVAVVVLLDVCGCRPPAAASAAPRPAPTSPTSHASLEPPREEVSPGPGDGPASDRVGALGVEDGRLPDGVTPVDTAYPAVANLDEHLRAALRRAAAAAADDGITVHLNSGWRSPAYQQHLLAEAVATYGSRREAARWVATPATSPHVSGDAVDVADLDATTWLSTHGARYGLCQVYANEPWHYELRPRAVDRGCPDQYADPSADPRMWG